MKKRFAKRALELIGAVAVVYIMLEIIESSSGVPESVSNGCTLGS